MTTFPGTTTAATTAATVSVVEPYQASRVAMPSAASVEGRGSDGQSAAVATGDGDGVSTGKGVGVASAVAVGMEVGVVSGADVADGLTDKEHATSSPVSEKTHQRPRPPSGSATYSPRLMSPIGDVAGEDERGAPGGHRARRNNTRCHEVAFTTSALLRVPRSPC